MEPLPPWGEVGCAPEGRRKREGGQLRNALVTTKAPGASLYKVSVLPLYRLWSRSH